MSEKQTEAQRLADYLVQYHGYPLSIKAAQELRRLDAKVAELEARMEAVGAGGIGPLMKEIRDDAAKTSSIDSQMNACMYRAACKRWRDQAEQQAEPVAEVLDEGGTVEYISYVPEPGAMLYAHPLPTIQLRDKVIKALTDYCNTGEIDGADDLLASILFARDLAKKPLTDE